MTHLSRRQLVTALSIPAIVASAAAGTIASTDAELVELGRQFDEVSAQIDGAVPTSPVSWATLNRFGEVYDQILAAQSQGIEGMRAKARLFCWVRLGDLDSEATDGKDIALSIVRDLIRLYDPHLERPGALKALVQDIE